jgi:two-component system sensor histidine kinase KdpD
LLEAFVRQVALVLDRQRLRDAEQDAKLLAESERLSKTLLDSISHEIRTPIAAITSAVSSLSDAREAPQIQRAMVAEIQEAAGRLNRLVGNLLSMTRLESGLPLARMDFVLMQQVLANLLLNAASHTPPGTTVRISAAMEEKTLTLTVADEGPGLPPDELPLIFEKFYRARTAPAGGTGLGLAIVKGFVEAQGGQVAAANRPGGGAVFAVRMPVGEQPTVSAETSESAHSSR